MSSREKILSAIKNNQPAFSSLPAIEELGSRQPAGGTELVQKFTSMLQSIGGHSKTVSSFNEIKQAIGYQFQEAKRIVSTFNELSDIAEVYYDGDVINKPEDIDVAILGAHFGVAENGAVWIPENIMCDRALPFITQHLVAIIKASTILPDMHAAYNKISNQDYGYSIFIAGPSKTADIEQSLVLGAHGPISMTVFTLE